MSSNSNDAALPNDVGLGNTRDGQATALATEVPAAPEPVVEPQVTADASINNGVAIDNDVAADNVAVGTSGIADAQQPVATEARNELPRTASPLALSGLLGLLSLAGAGGLRFFRG